MVLEEITVPITDIVSWLINSVALSLPKVIAALIILLIGWIIAVLLERLVKGALKKIKLDAWAAKNNIKKALFGLSLEESISKFTKWYIVLLFIVEAANRVDMANIALFFQTIIALIPTWLVGAGMLIISLYIGHWAKENITKSKMAFSDIVGGIVYGLVVYFGIVLALPKFGFENTEILIEAFKLFVGGVAVGLAIAIGIGFGMALKDPAKKFLKKWVK